MPLAVMVDDPVGRKLCQEFFNPDKVDAGCLANAARTAFLLRAGVDFNSIGLPNDLNSEAEIVLTKKELRMTRAGRYLLHLRC